MTGQQLRLPFAKRQEHGRYDVHFAERWWPGIRSGEVTTFHLLDCGWQTGDYIVIHKSPRSKAKVTRQIITLRTHDENPDLVPQGKVRAGVAGLFIDEMEAEERGQQRDERQTPQRSPQCPRCGQRPHPNTAPGEDDYCYSCIQERLVEAEVARRWAQLGKRRPT